MTPPTDQHRIYQGAIQAKNFPPLPDDWTSEFETFPSSDGKIQLYSVMHHKKDWKGKRILVVLHGLGEHGGRYLHFPHFLKSSVDGVYCLDHRGHGRSEGLRGHVDHFDLFIEDAALAIRRLHENLIKRFGQTEIHLFGHSMGGLITLRSILKHTDLPIRSVCVSAPLLKIAVEIPPLKKAAGRILARVWGSLQMTSEVNPGVLSHDQDVANAYVADRLVHKKVTPQLFTEMEGAMDATLKQENGISYPFQMILPLQDKIVDSNTALRFFRQLKLREKNLKTYPNFFHESFNEIGKEEVFADLLSWIQSNSA